MAPSLPPDVVRISVPSPFAIGAVNAYLIEAEPLTLIDPGPNTGDALQALEAGLAARGRRVEDVELVLLTHQHHDHVGLAGQVRERSGAQVAGLVELQAFLADFDASMDLDDAYAVALMRRHGISAEVAESLDAASRAMRRFGGGVRVDRPLADGDRIELGSRTLVVHARPGHSPTDTLFHDEATGLLIAGDHLLERVSSNPVAHPRPGVTDPRRAARAPDRRRPLLEYLESFGRTRALEVGLILPGHGDPFGDHRALIAEREAMHARRAERIYGLIDGEATAATIGRALWRRMAVTQTYLALSEVIGHVDLLAAQGRVREVEDADGELVRPARS